MARASKSHLSKLLKGDGVGRPHREHRSAKNRRMFHRRDLIMDYKRKKENLKNVETITPEEAEKELEGNSEVATEESTEEVE